MGLKDWFPFLRQKGYEPTVLHQSEIATAMDNHTRRVDVLSFFSVIRNAYSNNPLDQAHRILEQHLMKFGTKANLIPYVDGGQALEKQHTAKIRKAARDKAVVRCKRSLDELEQRLDNNLRVRKRHFTDVRTSLASTFYWSLPARQAFIEYMVQAGWTVRLCVTEADLAIALDYQPGDVVISADSDMLAYTSIFTLWRPISKNLLLVYQLTDIRRELGLSSAQLTALAVVPSNDYNKNIFSLGPATNYSVIKSLEKNDPRSIVSAYLANHQVLSKNTDNQTFELALRVFVDLEQTPVDYDAGSLSNNELRERFADLCARHEQLKKSRQTDDQKSTPKDEIARLRSSRTPNRFKTVESPAPTRSSLTGTQSPLQQSTSAPQHVVQPLPPLQQPPVPISSGTHSPLKELASTSQNDAQVLPSYLEPIGHPPLPRTRIPRHRPRYSFKAKKGAMQHPAPDKMKQFKLKPYKEPADKPSEPNDNRSRKPKPKPRSTSTASTMKLQVMRSMAYQHPTSSLYIGTPWANIKNALPNQPILQQEVIDCIQEASQEAARIKRKCQVLIGSFIERLDCMGLEHLSDTDREILDCFCPRLKIKDAEDKDDGPAEEDEEQDNTDLEGDIKGGKDTEQLRFLLSFASCLYSGNYPRDSGIGQKVNAFLSRLQQLGLYTPPQSRSETKETMPFPPGDLVRSVTVQLTAELKRMYRKGSYELQKKLTVMREKGLLRPDTRIQIREDLSAVENFVSLNKMARNSRKIVPITKSEQPFVTFSERDLTGFFFKRGGELKARLVELASLDGVCTSIKDSQDWIGGKEPGFLIKNFIADIDPSNMTSRKRGKAGRRASMKLLPLSELRSHLEVLDDPEFRPTDYAQKGYVSRGSLRTDGLRLQLLGFKLRELQCVRYRKLAADRLPPRITSTVGGVDYYLQEIRHVIEGEEDVARLWPGVDPHDIKILTLDAGQAYVVGAYAHLPQHSSSKSKGKAVVRNNHTTTSGASVPFTATSMSKDAPRNLISETSIASTPPTTGEYDKTIHHNLAVNQKAVLQPLFRYRRWLEGEKQAVPEDQSESIAHIESHLPPLRGPGSSVINYAQELQRVEDRLSDFYNGSEHRFKKHTLDMENAKQAEYQAIANRLLGIVGGSIGRRRDVANPVLIGVGLGKFQSTGRLSSLHSSFLSFFIQLARSLDYIVMGINEYYTSKKCPDCQDFVAQVTLRQFYCSHCKRYYHRDIMAAENMCKIVQGYLLKQERPRYLQPVTTDGRYPWDTKSITGVGTSISAACTSTGTSSQIRKRTSSVSNQPSGRPSKMAKEGAVDIV